MTNEFHKDAPLIRFIEEAEPVPDVWQVIASIAFGFLLFGIAAFFALMFITGIWIWSLLI